MLLAPVSHVWFALSSTANIAMHDDDCGRFYGQEADMALRQSQSYRQVFKLSTQFDSLLVCRIPPLKAH